MNAEKRCKHCSKWGPWNGQIDDKCVHCGEYLREEERVYEQKREAKRRQLELNFKEKWPFTVKPEDNIFVKIVKQIGFGIFFVFMSIISAFVWIMFWLAS